jgi:hypothetical protein
MGGEAEQLSIHLLAVPSFEAFGRFVESANPIALSGARPPRPCCHPA